MTVAKLDPGHILGPTLKTIQGSGCLDAISAIGIYTCVKAGTESIASVANLQMNVWKTLKLKEKTNKQQITPFKKGKRMGTQDYRSERSSPIIT